MPRTLVSLSLAATLLASTALAGPQAMTPDEARHLLARTGFGAAPHDITELTGQSRVAAVDRILADLRQSPATPMPAWTQAWPYPAAQIWALGQPSEELFYGLRWLEIEELQQWWLSEMITTPSPLTERLVLFWHDHFATSFEAVENSQWMADQNAFFRANAAGGFADLAEGILRDPAMLAYLTNIENVKDAPNENLAREYIELFTLGEGRGYTEADVKEAARALTGHGVEDLGAPVYQFDAESHDTGSKTILGRRGRLDAADLPGIVMQHPQFGPYIVEKLWLEFVSDQPDAGEVARLTGLWRDADWQMKPLLRAMFLSDAFWDPANRGRLVKSPVELFVGTVRTMGVPVPNLAEAAWALEDMGQALFFPPNVGGWPDGAGWINDAGAGQRSTYMTMLLDQDFEEAGQVMAYGMAEPAAKVVEVVPTRPQDLRVGKVFALESEAGEDGALSALLTLYDVGYAGQSWRSISLWIEHIPEEGPPFVGVHIADCAPDCLASWPREEDWPQWVGYAPAETEQDELTHLRRQDRELMAALMKHLPKLVRETRGHTAWTGYEDEEYEMTPASLSAVVDVAKTLRAASVEVLGTGRGKLVLEPSAHGSLGLGGMAKAPKSARQAERMLDRMYEDMVHAVLPRQSYDSAEDWLDALGTRDAAQVQAALLAVPSAQIDIAPSRDAEAALRALLLSPYYQVY